MTKRKKKLHNKGISLAIISYLSLACIGPHVEKGRKIGCESVPILSYQTPYTPLQLIIYYLMSKVKLLWSVKFVSMSHKKYINCYNIINYRKLRVTGREIKNVA